MSTRRLTVGQALVEFLAHQWTVDGDLLERDEVFRVSMRWQAEAFARGVGGSVCKGAQADDAIAAQRVAARATDALGRCIAAASRAA